MMHRKRPKQIGTALAVTAALLAIGAGSAVNPTVRREERGPGRPGCRGRRRRRTIFGPLWHASLRRLWHDPPGSAGPRRQPTRRVAPEPSKPGPAGHASKPAVLL